MGITHYPALYKSTLTLPRQLFQPKVLREFLLTTICFLCQHPIPSEAVSNCHKLHRWVVPLHSHTYLGYVSRLALSYLNLKLDMHFRRQLSAIFVDKCLPYRAGICWALQSMRLVDVIDFS